MNRKGKYSIVAQDKELQDAMVLVNKILEDEWIDSNLTIVNCFPAYSSVVSTILNHKLSIHNKNELFSIINLEMPYPNMSQVWSEEDREYELYDTYLDKWIKSNIHTSDKYLFICSAIVSGKPFSKLKLALKEKIDKGNYKIATPYLNTCANLEPDYYVQEFNFEQDGGLLFWWENENNKNWE